MHAAAGTCLRRYRRAAGLLATALLAAACQQPAPAADTVRAWANGPARWLLLPLEEEELRHVRTAAELSFFLGQFWARRDDDPSSDENPFAQLFAERVQAADRLYLEEELRGSLTDRGGALLLLGPPGILRTGQRRVPAWSGKPPPGARPTRLVETETWAYRIRDLPPRLRELLALAKRDGELALTFLVGNRRTRLIEGGELLVLAARAAARCPAEPTAAAPHCDRP